MNEPVDKHYADSSVLIEIKYNPNAQKWEIHDPDGWVASVAEKPLANFFAECLRQRLAFVAEQVDKEQQQVAQREQDRQNCQLGVNGPSPAPQSLGRF